jgi:predicted alpha/beta-fold hydrolase
VKYLNNQNKACPDQKFAIVGYSQGAMVMHLAFNNKEEVVSASAVKQIVGGAMYGKFILGASYNAQVKLTGN